MKFKSLGLLVVVMLLVMLIAGCGGDSKSSATTEQKKDGVIKINASHQPYSHGLPSYVAQKEGWFKAAGLDVNILFFTSGPAQNEALGANQWEVGAMGSPPAILGGIG